MELIRYSKTKLYYVLQVLGWSFLYLNRVSIAYNKTDSLTVRNLVFFLIYFAFAFLISQGLRIIYKRLYRKLTSIFPLLFIVVIASHIASYLWYFSAYFLDTVEVVLFPGKTSVKYIYSSYFKSKFYFNVLNYQPYFIIWSLAYFGIKRWIEYNQQQKEAQKAIELAKEAQYNMLVSQLNPHFLFNSLNSIQVLVEENKDVAVETITELSDILRYSLSNNTQLANWGSEMEIVKKYLSIEKKRFEDKLEVDYSISEESYSFPCIPFLVQPFVENAIKYGMRTSKMPLKLEIIGEIENSNLNLIVRNSGYWIDEGDKKSSTGNGIQNTVKRLTYLYKENYKFDIIKSNDSIAISIIIPKLNDLKSFNS